MAKIAEVTLRHLRYLVALADELHFRRAAERLHLTQPALSHQIRQLEEIIGVQLVDRTRRVTLTPAGETLVTHARRLLADVDSAVDATKVAGGSVATLSVCHSPSVRRILMPALMAALAKRNPALDVLWIERSEEAVGQELLRGHYDIVLGRFPLTDRGIAHEILAWERPGVYLDRSDPLAVLDEVPLEALTDRRIRTVRRETAPQHYEATIRDLTAAGREFSIEATMSYGNWESEEMRREIIDGECVLLGLSSADGTLHGTVVRPVTPTSPIPLTISWRSADARDGVRTFVEITRQTAAAIDAPWLASGPARDPEGTQPDVLANSSNA